MSVAMPGLARHDAATRTASRERVDVWQVALTTGDPAAVIGALSDPERAHASRLRVGASHWVAARVALRRVLGRYLGVAPGDVALETGANGKPRLAPGAGPDLRFNLSHAAGLALIAVRQGFEVGIDVEQVRAGVDGAAIVRETFTARERGAMPPAGANGANAEFFRAWARREALAKATGLGIAGPETAGDPGGHAVLDLPVGAGFAAALASEGTDWTVRWHLA
jgi:4'-phosphopantetheinyl transferase